MSGSKIGLRLLHFRKYTPNITGRDKFSKINACPSKKNYILDNFILTSTCPTVLIVEFTKAPLALGKFDGLIKLTSPPNVWKKCLRNGDSGGQKRSGIDKVFNINKRIFTSSIYGFCSIHKKSSSSPSARCAGFLGNSICASVVWLDKLHFLH